jgi:hypothetical protein
LTAGLGAVIAAASLAACDGGDSTGVENARGRAVDGRWTPAPRAPGSVAGYQNLSAHVVGDRIIVVAEVDYDQATVKVLTYALSEDRWAAADSGIWWRVGSARVATGDQVILHGGCCGPGGSGDRAPAFAYDVRRDRWREIRAGPLGNRFGHVGVWTGRQAVFWGGSNGDLLNDGAAYDPGADAWRRIAAAPIEPRADHVAVWTGDEMIVWGGTDGTGRYPRMFLRDGAAYDPQTDSWRRIGRAPTLPQLGAEAEPDATDAIWTGDEMVVWNGQQGAAYDPEADAWRRIRDAPPSRLSALGTDRVVWTGEEMIVSGGVRHGDDFLSSAAAYDPDADRWQVLPAPPLEGRDRHAVAWTSDGMLVWGGCCRGTRYFSDGAFFRPE